MIVCIKVVKLQSVSYSVVIRCGKANGAGSHSGRDISRLPYFRRRRILLSMIQEISSF